MGVPTKIGFFFWGFEVTYPPIFKGSESNGAIKFPNLSPFERYGGCEISGGPDRWGHEGLIIQEFESFKVIYPPIFKCFEANGEVSFAKKCMVCKI
jgi:hypothetical protein